MSLGADDLLQMAWAAIDHGDLFTAYDIAAQPLAAGHPTLPYIKALALARMGDWRGALGVYHAEGLDRRDDIDCLTLKARLLKDRAFDDAAANRAGLLRQARDAYRTAFDRTGGDFAAINAASLSLMAGDIDTAHGLARDLLQRNADAGPADYWQGASMAEALIVLGRFEEGHAALEAAVALPLASAAARNSTYLQLTRLLAAQGKADSDWVGRLLGPIEPEAVAHFCGMMFETGSDAEAPLAEAVTEALRGEKVGKLFGALACGSDIVIAEQALRMGLELHVVLPFDREDFVFQSVAIGGSSWEARFERCLAGATGVHMATTMRFVNDDGQFAFGSRTAMGLARVRARQMHARTVQIAVCNDETRRKGAGTAADIAIWRAAGGRTHIIRAPGVRRPEPAKASALINGRASEKRSLRVLVFADFQGFSRLPEHDIPRFWKTVMAGCAEALAPYGAHILAANTWGDGLHIVFDEVSVAAQALVALWDAMRLLEQAGTGKADRSGMRIAAHFGSVYEMTDPVTGRTNFYGTEVSRAARLEPITPPGSIYITEPMAAAVEMEAGDRFRSRYVGRLSLPKNFGSERIYSLESWGTGAEQRGTGGQ
jgi:tetratricopeptide (TPR) repeat protein